MLKLKSTKSFKSKLNASNSLSKEIGNTYTASVFMGLASLLSKEGGVKGGLKEGKNITMFSYGSGALATMYRLTLRKPTKSTRFGVGNMCKVLDINSMLRSREKVHPEVSHKTTDDKTHTR